MSRDPAQDPNQHLTSKMSALARPCPKLHERPQHGGKCGGGDRSCCFCSILTFRRPQRFFAAFGIIRLCKRWSNLPTPIPIFATFSDAAFRLSTLSARVPYDIVELFEMIPRHLSFLVVSISGVRTIFPLPPPSPSPSPHAFRDSALIDSRKWCSA